MKYLKRCTDRHSLTNAILGSSINVSGAKYRRNEIPKKSARLNKMDKRNDNIGEKVWEARNVEDGQRKAGTIL